MSGELESSKSGNVIYGLRSLPRGKLYRSLIVNMCLLKKITKQ